MISSAPNGTRFLLQDGTCRLENSKEFMIKGNERPFFSARHPSYQIDNRIKKVSTKQIVTNKLRSPINENLRIDVENLTIRGNEGIQMDSKRFNATARNNITLKTTKDGRLTMSARRIFIGNRFKPLPMSTSPALTASIDAYRVCMCIAVRQKLFIVPGNKPCHTSRNYCI
ncbi:hypothetical protein AB6A40_007675 [Gnathostoma spinigerum]|uniref:Beta-sarcoglycan n=1 Tax=Gnathostoma spinigerum TaxID=75299 RepID=A0ABD6EU37_9BILA